MEKKKEIAKDLGSRKVREWLEEENRRERENREERMEEYAAMDEDFEVEDEPVEHVQKKRPAVQKSLHQSGGLDFCDPRRQELINQAITIFLVGCAIPFTVTNSSFFIDMIASLNTAYVKVLPKTDTFRRTHLPKLFNDTVANIKEMWRLIGNPLLTIGYDGHTNDGGGQCLLMTETAEEKTAFTKCIDPGEMSEDAQFLSNIVIEEMKVSSNDEVEEHYVGTVCDNVSCNRSASRLIERKYPKLFTPGCCTHVSDLMMEDFCKISSIKEIIDDCRFIAVFLKSYRKIKNCYKKIIEKEKGTLIPLYPETRFSYADLTMQKITKNFRNLQLLIEDSNWSSNVTAVPETKRTRFINLVESWEFLNKIQAIRGVSSPLSKMTHHFESSRVRASWIYPMFRALLNDVECWADKDSTKRVFNSSLREEVKNKIILRWEGLTSQGHRRLVPFKNDLWICANVLDPYYTPTTLEEDAVDKLLKVDKLKSIRTVMKKFYDGFILENAINEMFSLIKLHGRWG